MTNEERIFRTNSILEITPPYGEFEVALEEKMQFIDGGNFLDPKNTILSDVNNAIEQNKLKHQAFLDCNTIIQELIDNGFMINRHDIKVPGRIYRQLTDKGRELKELGSMEAFNLHVANNNRKRQLQDQKSNRLYWINFWIAVAAVAAMIYYILEILRIQYHLGLPNHVFFQ